MSPDKITQETLNDHHTLISIGGRPICNLGCADDIDLMGDSNGELQDFTNRFIDRAVVVSTEKSKIMTNMNNNMNNSADINKNS